MKFRSRYPRVYLWVLLVALVFTTFAVTSVLSQQGPSWPQWAQNPQHTGFLNVAGQNLNQNLANIVYDALVADEMQAVVPLIGEKALLVHYQTPLSDGNDVYMESKAGTYSARTLSTDPAGNVYYNVVQLAPGGTSFYSKDVVDSWLVSVAPDDTITKVSYSTLLATARINGEAVPGPNDRCKLSFSNSQLPWPPSPDAVSGTTPCGTQRAALNVAPAIAPDGTIYTISRGHFVR